MEDFEKLGAFYLGRPYDLKSKTRGAGLVLYDSKDLVTHGVCVGMTGSGKTGLCIGLLEEAAIERILSRKRVPASLNAADHRRVFQQLMRRGFPSETIALVLRKRRSSQENT